MFSFILKNSPTFPTPPLVISKEKALETRWRQLTNHSSVPRHNASGFKRQFWYELVSWLLDTADRRHQVNHLLNKWSNFPELHPSLHLSCKITLFHIINPLLTKREVKMAGYWARSINTQEKEVGQHPVILTSRLGINSPYAWWHQTSKFHHQASPLKYKL